MPFQLYIMQSVINNYHIRRLLLTGDYVCTDSQGHPFVLSPCQQSPPLLHNVLVQNLVLPLQVTYLSDTPYYCYSIPSHISHCLSTLRASLSPPFPLSLIFSLALTVLNISKDRQLREEAMGCLQIGNLWTDRKRVFVLWNMRGKRDRYSEVALVRRLGELAYWIWEGKELGQARLIDARRRKGDKNSLDVRRVIDLMLTAEIPLEEAVITLQIGTPQKIIAKPQNLTNKGGRYSIHERARVVSHKKQRSIDKTELSLQKSLNLMKDGYRQYRLIPPRRDPRGYQHNYSPKKRNYNTILRYSQTLRPSDCRSIDLNSIQKHSIDAHNYSPFIKQSQIENVSELVRLRALEAYDKERRVTIDLEQTIDVQIRDRNLRETISQEKQRLHDAITARRVKGASREDFPIELTYKERRSISLIGRGNRLMQARMRRESKVIQDVQEIYQRHSVRSKPKDSPKHITEKFEDFDYLQKTPIQVIDKPHQQKANPKPAPIAIKQESSKTAAPVIPTPKVQKPPTPSGVQSSILKPPTPSLVKPPQLQKPPAPTKPHLVPSQVIQKDPYDEISEIKTVEKQTKPAKAEAKPTGKSVKQVKQVKELKQIPKAQPPIAAPVKTKPKDLSDDELQQISLQPAKKPAPPTPKLPPPTPPPAPPKPQVRKTLKSESSIHSQKPMSVNSQVEEYISFINLMGQAVGKSQKAVKGITGIQWFTGVYYIYKRFLKQRKNIENWLEKGQNKLSRPGKVIDQAAFEKWMLTQQKNAILLKIKKDNAQIQKAIGKMYQSILKRSIDPKVVKHADLNVNSQQDSFIAVEYGLSQCQQLLDLDEVSEELLFHIVEIVDSLYIIAELDGKTCLTVDLKERRSLKGDLTINYLEKQEKFIPKLKKNYGLE